MANFYEISGNYQQISIFLDCLLNFLDPSLKIQSRFCYRADDNGEEIAKDVNRHEYGNFYGTVYDLKKSIVRNYSDSNSLSYSQGNLTAAIFSLGLVYPFVVKEQERLSQILSSKGVSLSDPLLFSTKNKGFSFGYRDEINEKNCGCSFHTFPTVQWLLKNNPSLETQPLNIPNQCPFIGTVIRDTTAKISDRKVFIYLSEEILPPEFLKNPQLLCGCKLIKHTSDSIYDVLRRSTLSTPLVDFVKSENIFTGDQVQLSSLDAVSRRLLANHNVDNRDIKQLELVDLFDVLERLFPDWFDYRLIELRRNIIEDANFFEEKKYKFFYSEFLQEIHSRISTLFDPTKQAMLLLQFDAELIVSEYIRRLKIENLALNPSFFKSEILKNVNEHRIQDLQSKRIDFVNTVKNILLNSNPSGATLTSLFTNLDVEFDQLRPFYRHSVLIEKLDTILSCNPITEVYKEIQPELRDLLRILRIDLRKADIKRLLAPSIDLIHEIMIDLMDAYQNPASLIHRISHLKNAIELLPPDTLQGLKDKLNAISLDQIETDIRFYRVIENFVKFAVDDPKTEPQFLELTRLMDVYVTRVATRHIDRNDKPTVLAFIKLLEAFNTACINQEVKKLDEFYNALIAIYRTGETSDERLFFAKKITHLILNIAIKYKTSACKKRLALHLYQGLEQALNCIEEEHLSIKELGLLLNLLDEYSSCDEYIKLCRNFKEFNQIASGQLKPLVIFNKTIEFEKELKFRQLEKATQNYELGLEIAILLRREIVKSLNQEDFNRLNLTLDYCLKAVNTPQDVENLKRLADMASDLSGHANPRMQKLGKGLLIFTAMAFLTASVIAGIATFGGSLAFSAMLLGVFNIAYATIITVSTSTMLAGVMTYQLGQERALSKKIRFFAEVSKQPEPINVNPQIIDPGQFSDEISITDNSESSEVIPVIQ